MRIPTPEESSLGPVIPEMCALPIIGKIGQLSVYLVDSSVETDIRQNIAHVAMVAQRSMPKYPAGYDGSVTEDDQRLYILAAGERAVGFVLTALDERFWRLSWKADGAIELLGQEALLRRGPKVARVWVAGEYRRKRVSIELLQLSVQHWSVEVSALGWELPFTPSGAALVQRILPTLFLGCGDRYSLYHSLTTAPGAQDQTYG